MNHSTANSKSVNESPLLTALPDGGCQHHTRKGRCTMPAADPSGNFCPTHARRNHKQNEAATLATELTTGLAEFKSAIPINDFLSRLLHLQAEDRIQPRRASVMAYTCNLLLRTLPAIEKELHPGDDDEVVHLDFGDLPRPQRN